MYGEHALASAAAGQVGVILFYHDGQKQVLFSLYCDLFCLQVVSIQAQLRY